MKINREQSEWVHFQMFSARRTADLKAQRVEVNQGLDLDLQVATGEFGNYWCRFVNFK